MRFAICNEIFKGWDVHRMCAFVRQAGYEALEVAPFMLAPLVTDITAAQKAELRQAVKNEGLSISGIHWVLAFTEGMHVNHPNPEWCKRASDYLAEAVRFCAEIGGTHMIFGSPKRREILPGVTPEQAVEWALDTFRPAIRQAEKSGVTICMEPLGMNETNFLQTAHEAIEFVKLAQSPAFRIMLDVKAMCSEETPIPEIIKASAPYTAYFHANDRSLKGPGFGDTDFVPIAAALKETGYNGYVSVEVFNFDDGPEAIATRSRQYLRQVFGE
ncbi:MAG TPA: sugar phosphate isomerase/epimerase family protein [Candidatus Limnocylindria bacterium]|jgi:sugar phosphate isomerase/epimerase|nr:sugar phosphate isomerase/epimerase family protein [Candidatus Limnocylindria bacterium]